jgi:hypothetical protein
VYCRFVMIGPSNRLRAHRQRKRKPPVAILVAALICIIVNFVYKYVTNEKRRFTTVCFHGSVAYSLNQ